MMAMASVFGCREVRIGPRRGQGDACFSA